MKILTIVHYDTMQGSVHTLVEMPEGKTDDEVFLAWLKVKRKEPDLTMEKINENDGYLYHWEGRTVETWESLQGKKT